MCLKGECLFKAQDTALSACYKVILFFLQDKRPRYWYPIPGGQRRAAQDEKERIERLRPCLAKDGTHWLQNHAKFQSSVLLFPVLSSRDTFPSPSCRGRGPLLLSATVTPSGQKSFHLRTEKQLPVCPSLAQLTEFGVGREQQWGSQGYAAAPSRAVLREGTN